MRFAGLATVLLAACGGPRPGPAKVEVVAAPPDAAPEVTTFEPGSSSSPIDWTHATWATDDEALALWDQLGITGDNYEILLGEIPRKPAEAMSKALLRQGGFLCAATPIQVSCELTEMEFLAVPPEATLADPCLRRRLALWSLDNLDDDTLTEELVADAIALAGLPPPESELNRAVLYRFGEHEAVRLQMLDAAMNAGNDQIADESLGGLSIAGLEAAVAMHIDGAVYSLDGSSTAVLGRATVDPMLRRETRAAAAQSLGYWVLDMDPSDPSRQVAYDALIAAGKADDCAVAGAARAQLATIQNQPFPAPLAKGAKIPAVMRHMCEVISGRGDEYLLWDQLIDEKGVTVRRTVRDPERLARLWEEYPEALDVNKDGAPDVEDADPDGDGDPATTHEVLHLDRDGWLDQAALVEDLRRVLPDCKGTSCHLKATGADFTLQFRKGRKGLVLDAIDVEETAGGC